MGTKRGIDKIDTDEELQAITRGLKRIVRERTSKLEKARRELEASEEKLRLMFESVNDGIVFTDLNGVVIDVNEKALQLGEFSSKNDIVGKSAFEVIAYHDREKAVANMQELLKEGGVETAEHTLVKVDGSHYPTEISASVVKDAAGNPVGFISVIRDITERKRAEQLLQQRTYDLGERVKELSCLYGTSTLIEKQDISSEELLHGTIDLISPAWQYPEITCVRIILDGQEFTTKNFRETMWKQTQEIIVHGDRFGTLEVCYLEERPQMDEGPFVREERSLIDAIAKLLGHAIERKRAEEELEAGRKKLEGYFESMIDGVCVNDANATITQVNRSLLEMFGYESQDEIIGRPIFEFVPEKEVPRTVNRFMKTVEEKEPFIRDFEVLASRKDGKEFPMVINIRNLWNKGKYGGSVSVLRDITERKRAEEELIRLSNAVRMATDSIVIGDFQANIIEVNEATLRMYGTDDKADLLGKNALELIAPEDKEKVFADREQVLETGYSDNVEYHIIIKDGSRILVEMSTAIMKGVDGKPTGFVAVSRDSTERKRAEEELSLLSNAVRMSTDSIMITDMEANIIDVNEATLKMYGTDNKEELVGKHAFDIIAPEDREKALAGAKEVLETGYAENIEYHIITKYGSRILLEISTAIMTGVDGKPTGIVVVSRDITERKRMEEALRESEEKLRLTFESIGDGIIVTDLVGQIAEVNQAALRLTGYSREEFIGRSAIELIAEKDRSKAMEDLREVLEEGLSKGGITYSILAADGRELEVEFSSAVLRDSSGNPVGFIGVARDITERKRMEEALRESEEKLRFMFASITDGIIVTDLAGNIAEVNDAARRMFGYSNKEVFIGRNAFEFVSPKDHAMAMEEMRKALEEGRRLERSEYTLLAADGREFEADFSGALLRDSSGNPVGFIGVMRDITERKRMEEELRESEERLRALIENAPDGIYINDLMGTFIDGNRKAEELIGYAREELIGKNFVEAGLLPEEYLPAALAGLEQNIRGEASGPDEFELIRKDGSRVSVEIRTFPVARKGKVDVLGIARDITERKRAEQELSRLSSAVRMATDSIVISDLEANIIDVNEATLRMYGTDDKADLVGKSAFDLIAPEDREKALAGVKEVLERGYTKNVEYHIIPKDGGRILVEMSSAIIRGMDGKPTGFVGVSRDITKRKRMEQALQESEHSYRVLFESGIDGVFVIDAETMKVVLANQLAARMYGFNSAEDAIGENPLDFVHPDDRERALSAIVEDMFEKDLHQIQEFRTITKDGKEKWIGALGKTIEYQGKLAGLVSLRDITERKRAERIVRERTAKLEKAKKELEETASHLSTLQAITGVGLSPMGLDEMLQELLNHFIQGIGTSFGVIWLLDQEREKLRARASLHPEGLELSLDDFTLDIEETSFFEIFKVPAPSFLGEKHFPSLPIDDRLKKSLKDTQIKSLMFVPFTYQGKVIGAVCCGWRERREFTSRERGLIQVMADRAATAIEFHRLNEETRQKSVELEQKNIELMRVNELKSEFLANMSHELRTPMNAIMGYTSLMLRERYGTLTDKQTEALWRVDRNAKNLLTLISSILDLSKVEAGKMLLYHEAVDLRELVEEVISTVEPMIREAKLALDTAVAEDTPALWTDRSKLKQIILNLLSNAVKFTPKGGITVSAWGSDGLVKVAVTDTGIGIKEENLKIIFEEFRQLDGSTTRNQGGTGLGLAIAKKFVNLLGGDIELESVYGQGSTFTITIPCIAPPQLPKHIPEPIAEVPSRPTTAAKTLLAIDDDPDIIALLRENLIDTDYEVVGAQSGEEGINRAADLQPFAITLDILMPHRDGWYVIHKLKSDPKTAHIPVIIISIIEEKHLAYSLGVADYIVKPIERDLLITKLKRLERVGQREALVIDDDPKVVNLLRDILQGEGYTVRTALSGSDAITEIEAKPPDYLFLDIEMSEINGFDVLNHVWEKPYGKEMIIVVTSARQLTPEERDFLSKRSSIMIRKANLYKKKAVEELKLALTTSQGKKGVRGNETEDSSGRG